MTGQQNRLVWLAEVLGIKGAVGQLASGLRRGSKGPAVLALQQALGLMPDGVYGAQVAQALRDVEIAGPDRAQLGRMSRQYESGAGGVATVSSGAGDAGGVSYGAHQLASANGSMAAFLSSPEGAPFAATFDTLQPGEPAFSSAYVRLASERGAELEAAQKQYTDRTHYEPVLAYARKLGFDVRDRGLQEALYSQAIQTSFKGNKTILDDAAKQVAAQSGALATATAENQIRAIYLARGEYTTSLPHPPAAAATTERYAREVEEAVQVSRYQTDFHQKEP